MSNENWKEDLLDKLHRAINNAVTLEIVTAVGFVKPDPLDIDWAREPVVALSKINLLLGDIKTVYPEEFVTGSYQSLKDFHAQREREGHQIIENNIKVLKELYALVASWTA